MCVRASLSISCMDSARGAEGVTTLLSPAFHLHLQLQPPINTITVQWNRRDINYTGDAQPQAGRKLH